MTGEMDERLQEWADSAAYLFGQRLMSILEMQNDEISRLRDEVLRLRDLVEKLVHQSADAAVRPAPTREESTEEPVPGPPEPVPAVAGQVLVLTEKEFAHHTLSERYRHIVDQRLTGLADKLLDAQADGRERSIQEAQLVARLCRILFSGLDFDPGQLAGEFADQLARPGVHAELDRVCGEVSSLLTDIAAAGELEWRFDAEIGKLPDLEWQDVWPGCPADAPVRLVVAPAYAAHGRIFSRQQIFTSHAKLSRKFLRRIIPGKDAPDQRSARPAAP